MHAWQLQDAKSRFSELVECALNEGPQLVTRRGNDAVVLMAAVPMLGIYPILAQKHHQDQLAAAAHQFVHHAGLAGCKVIVSGLQPQPLEMLDRAGLGLGSERVAHAPDFPAALAVAASRTRGAEG
mgnify:CR=1 FL=1